MTANGVLAGRTVVITGAGDGVGRGIALACAAAGAYVVVMARRENGAETVGLIAERGSAGEWVRGDVTLASDVEAAVATAVAAGDGGFDAMIHNATSRRSSEPARLEDVDDECWDDHAAVSLRGAYHCARAALPALRERKGTLILMTSPAGMEGSATLPLYGVVKAALRGFAKSLAREWAPLGATVNLVSPLAQTPAMVNAIREDPALADRLAARVPMGRLGDPETDIGPVVAFLASGGAGYVTGQTLPVDGGRFMTL
ncbi:MAG: SDR family NAD(P)-dependent oxidoreductase [Acidimicrobiia bacterium]